MPRRTKPKADSRTSRLPGRRLRRVREQLGMTLREVAEASARIACSRRNERFKIQASRLHDVETRDRVPSIFRLYSLATIYRRPVRELLALYGIDTR